MIRVLVVEDSPLVQELLVHILGADPAIRVIGTARDGGSAFEIATGVDGPDVVTMDINMPRMDGLEATRKIMETKPLPIVIVSGNWDAEEVQTTFQALQAGALTCLGKPLGVTHPGYREYAKRLVETVKVMSDVKVVTRRRPASTKAVPRPSLKVRRGPIRGNVKLVVIGASTGGPIALAVILSGLPKDFPVPLLIAQHLADGFASGLSAWLARTSGVPVHIAADGEQLLPGHVYLAPDGCDLEVTRDGAAALSQSATNGASPSVSRLFRSVASAFGANAIGVLLTGMGNDGAQELKLMKEKGCITIAQDEESSVVHGMPGSAIALKGASHVLPPKEIALTLRHLAKTGVSW